MYEFPLPQCQVTTFQGQITSHAGFRALPTVGLQQPCAYEISISDNNEIWKLRARQDGENDDDVSFLVPDDYNASTNKVIWVRIS